MKDKIIIVLLSIIFVSILVYLAFSFGKMSAPSTVATTPTPTALIPTSPVTPASSEDFGKINWYASPRAITNPPVLSSTTTPDMGGYSFAPLGSFEVGQFSSGAKLLVSFIVPEGPSSPMPFRIISQNNHYFLIESLINDDYTKKNLDLIFDQTKIKLIAYQLKDLYPDSTYSINQHSFNSVPNTFALSVFISSLKDFQKFASTPSGDMIYTDRKITDLPEISIRQYYLKLADFTLLPYKLFSDLYFTNDQVPSFNLLDNSSNKTVYQPIRNGCDGNGYTSVITDASLISARTLIGHTSDTPPIDIFKVNSADSTLVKYLYNQYKVGHDYPSAPPFLPIDQFAAAPNHIIFQERTGDYVLFVNPEYLVQAECGKPVVYLYPTTDTQVSIKVGAAVTKSEPLYPQSGWTVLAHPNGQINYQNNSYPNLFWEGTGIGAYNNHQGEGFVVSQSDLISTLESQLLAQGLNAQESADFLAFWQPKLPSSPYVRLTWLNTADMNQLAPLQVNPIPKTVIRTFLEFEGLSKPITLIPQKLSSLPRTGFTLVEWGGLLR